MKYVIEPAFEDMSIQKIMQLGLDANGQITNWTDSIEDVEELNSDYINEHYGSLQDEAYQKGYEACKNNVENGCEGCKYESISECEQPCRQCKRGCMDFYDPMPEDDRIEVGDEVVWKAENITLIVTSTYETRGLNWCDGVAQDGKVYHTLIENNRKTGKHYDIQSILEAMKS